MKARLPIRSSTAEDGFELEVRDDGRGLDHDKLRQRAVQLKLETAKKIKSWSDDQTLQVIFRPGFSTVETADLIAGRGIGMDLVKRKVEQANGSIVIRSVKGDYCAFTIILNRDIS